MTGPDQYLAAESLLDSLDFRGFPDLTVNQILLAAQVRATLALAAAYLAEGGSLQWDRALGMAPPEPGGRPDWTVPG